MPRAYADVLGRFRQGEAGSYARAGDYDRAARTVADDPDLASSYANMGDAQRRRRREESDDAFSQSYADAFSRNDYDAMETIAGKHGNIQGVEAARTGRTQANTQQRQDRIRRAIGYLSSLEAIDSMPENERQAAYTAWLQQAQGEAEGEGVGFLQSLPPNYAPNVTGALSEMIDRAMESELGPEEWFRLRRQGGGERRFTSASGGILDTYTGEVQPNPHYVRGGRSADDNEAERAARDLGVQWDD
jgi:hypothetical protein